MIAIVLTGCADKLILFPTTAPIPAPGASRRTVPFDGGHLELWVSRSASHNGSKAECFVLEFIGNAARAEMVAPEACDGWDRPVEAWCVNHPGFGGSTGPARLAKLGPAALAAYDALAIEAAGRPIFIRGTSLGTTMALHVAANRPVSGLILRTPPPLKEMILGEFGWWNMWLLAGPVAMAIPSELDSLHNAARTTAPAIFLIADRDEIVPCHYQHRVASAFAGPRQTVIMRGSGHNSATSAEIRRELASQFKWLWAKATAPRVAVDIPPR